MRTLLMSISMLLTSATAMAQTAPKPAASPCADPEYGRLDFWVGRWDVYPTGKDKLVAHSLIEKVYGCAIRENWMPLKGADGGSLNNLDPATGRWHQTWIGSAPGRAEFEGGLVDGKMVLTGYWNGSGPNGEDGLTRMTYSRQNGGAVRQFGEFSADHGLTWQTSFDLIYRPHKAGD